MMSAMEKNVNFKGTWGKKVRCRFGSNDSNGEKKITNFDEMLKQYQASVSWCAKGC